MELVAKTWWRLVPERRSILLDQHNVVAAAQILSWVAMPHRPQAGVDLLCNWYWARRKHRGDTVLDLPFDLKKPNRLEQQLETFRHRVLRGFRAGSWFQLRVLSAPNQSTWFADFDVSIRSLARRQLPPSRRGGESEAEGNPIRDIWSRRKPIAHMAIAAGDAIAEIHLQREVPGFDLEMTLFDPVWLVAALEAAESRAHGASLVGAFDLSQMHRFYRDTF